MEPYPLTSSTIRTIYLMLTEEISDFVGRAQTFGQEHVKIALDKLAVRICALAEVLNAQALGAEQCRELRASMTERDCWSWAQYLRYRGEPLHVRLEAPSPARLLADRIGL